VVLFYLVYSESGPASILLDIYVKMNGYIVIDIQRQNISIHGNLYFRLKYIEERPTLFCSLTSLVKSLKKQINPHQKLLYKTPKRPANIAM